MGPDLDFLSLTNLEIFRFFPWGRWGAQKTKTYTTNGYIQSYNQKKIKEDEKARIAKTKIRRKYLKSYLTKITRNVRVILAATADFDQEGNMFGKQA